MSWFYYFGRFLIRVILFLFSSTHIEGLENLPKHGALLVVSNHLSSADPPILGACLYRKAVFMAKEELFRHWFSRYFIRGFGAFPVHRGRLDRKAIRHSEKVLSRGMVLMMFPEAKRSSDARLGKAYDGAALIAARTNVPLLPAAITGSEVMRGLSWLLKRPKVKVTIGEPFSLPEKKGKASREELGEYTYLIMRQIAALLPEGYRGEYPAYGEDDETEG